MNHCLRTYQWSCRLFKEEEDDDQIAVLPISIADSDRAVLATLGYSMDKRPLQKQSKLSEKPSNSSV